MWKIAITVLLCALRISNLGWWGMSVAEEQEEIAVFCHQRKSKLGFRESHPNCEVMGDPLVQVTPGVLLSLLSQPFWVLIPASSVAYSLYRRQSLTEKLRTGPETRDQSAGLSSSVWPAVHEKMRVLPK